MPLDLICLHHAVTPRQRYGYREVAVNKFLRLGEIQFGPSAAAAASTTQVDDVKSPPTTRPWEIAQRTTRPSIPLSSYSQSPAPLPVDSVDIRALVTRGGCTYLVVIAQYRPPLDAVCLEFPAGLLDAGESPVDAALRELHEETGLEVSSTSSPTVRVAEDLAAYEPGMSDSCFYFVTVQVDGDAPSNQAVRPRPDDGEEIDVWLVPHDARLREGLQMLKKKYERCVIDGKLYAYALAKE